MKEDGDYKTAHRISIKLVPPSPAEPRAIPLLCRPASYLLAHVQRFSPSLPLVTYKSPTPMASGTPEIEHDRTLPLADGGTRARTARGYASPLAEITYTVSADFSLTARA